MDQPPEFTAEAHHPEEADRRDAASPWVLVPMFGLISLVGGLFPSFSLQANLYVTAIGGTVFWLGLSTRVHRLPTPGRPGRAAAWWLLPGLALALIELGMFIAGSTDDYPTLSLLADPILDGYLARSAAYFGWISAFWGLIRR